MIFVTAPMLGALYLGLPDRLRKSREAEARDGA